VTFKVEGFGMMTKAQEIMIHLASSNIGLKARFKILDSIDIA
jgi:hypothetical protein